MVKCEGDLEKVLQGARPRSIAGMLNMRTIIHNIPPGERGTIVGKVTATEG